MTLLSLSFSREVFAEISLFPLLYGVTCIVASVIFAVIYRIVAAFKAKTKKQKEYNQTDEENRKSLKETSKFMADIALQLTKSDLKIYLDVFYFYKY